MALTIEQKKQVVAEVSEVAANALSAVAAEYHGLGVEELTALRKVAREKGVYLRVVKNTLAKRAVADTEFECMTDGFVGPLMLAFSQEGPGDAARLVKDFAKENEALQTKMVAISGEVYGADALDRVASLPTRDEALSKLLGTMQAPVQKLLGTFNAVPTKLVRTVAAIKDAKEAA
ncbi:ribosomal protein L10 [gamma proteobacterium HTCC5015]|nr:ribosomal protein L10 [gamma proteobacterium HTCC5015]